MKSILKISLLLLLPFFGKSQSNQKLDSLHRALNMAENDRVRLEVTNRLYVHYEESNRDSAMFYLELGLAISKKINQPLWTAYHLLDKAYMLQKQGNLSLSFKLINESMTIAKDEKNEINVYLPESTSESWDSHKWRLNIIGNGYHQFGNTYRQAGNYEKSIASFKEVIRIAEENKMEAGVVNPNMNIGGIYLDLNKLDSAMLYSRNAIRFSNSSGYKTYQGQMLRVIGNIFSKQNQLDSAKYYYWKSLNVSREQGNVASEISTNIALAKLYEGITQTDSLLYYANAGFRMASGLKVGAEIASAAELVSTAFKRKGNLDSALTYLSISKQMGDSLNKARIKNLTEFQNIGFEEQMRLEKNAQESIASKNKIRTIALFGGLGLLSVLVFVFYRNNRQKQKANILLQNQKDKVESTLSQLKSTQAQLIQKEKLAALGELTAGIAHEIQNPLNFVNNFSELSVDLVKDLKEEIEKSPLTPQGGIIISDKAYFGELFDDLSQNQEKINLHGKRASSIVKGMLEHSRASTGVKELTDINKLADEYLRLSYHGLRAKDNSFNSDYQADFDESLPKIEVIPQDIGRVLLNLINNAFWAVKTVEKPLVVVKTEHTDNQIIIKVKDNGTGMTEDVKAKIFQPFFTTKPTGQGTGLGLSLAYDIVTKGHGGTIECESVESEGTTFTVKLPLSR